MTPLSGPDFPMHAVVYTTWGDSTPHRRGEPWQAHCLTHDVSTEGRHGTSIEARDELTELERQRGVL